MRKQNREINSLKQHKLAWRKYYEKLCQSANKTEEDVVREVSGSFMHSAASFLLHSSYFVVDDVLRVRVQASHPCLFHFGKSFCGARGLQELLVRRHQTDESGHSCQHLRAAQ